jgi:NAD-dependent dihydropyrimidine dehydrogenase PreA subunit
MVQFVTEVYEGLRTFMIGMKVTGFHLKDNLRPNPKGVTTIPYDGTADEAGKVQVAERFRGNLVLDTERCGGCRNCMRVCPIDCFWIEVERTAGKQRVSRFDVDILRCMYCGLCVMNCPTKCLRFSQDWGGSVAALKPGADEREREGCLLHHFGKGFLSEAEKLEIERQRRSGDEARKKAAEEAAAKKAAEAKTAAEAKPSAPPAPVLPATPPAPSAPEPPKPPPSDGPAQDAKGTA